MQLTLNDPLDMHLHLRDGKMLETTAPLSARSFSGALIMPNIIPPVASKEALISYKQRIIETIGNEHFTPYMTLFFRKDYDYDFLNDIRNELTAIKLYPSGITTNSEGGVEGFEIEALKMPLEAMSAFGIPLCIHGETNGFVLDREAEFIPIYEKLATAFPKLKIIMEHITTKESLQALDRHENLYATITAHHLLITLDDVAGGMLHPHLFCKPIAKRSEDRDALIQAATNAHPKIMFGSDSAPHPQSAKECSGCAAGIFTAPIALPLLAELFETHNKLQNLQSFISDHAKKIYDIDPPKKSVTLEKESFEVPQKYGNIVPMQAGEELTWKIEKVQRKI